MNDKIELSRKIIFDLIYLSEFAFSVLQDSNANPLGEKDMMEMKENIDEAIRISHQEPMSEDK